MKCFRGMLPYPLSFGKWRRAHGRARDFRLVTFLRLTADAYFATSLGWRLTLVFTTALLFRRRLTLILCFTCWVRLRFGRSLYSVAFCSLAFYNLAFCSLAFCNLAFCSLAINCFGRFGFGLNGIGLI